MQFVCDRCTDTLNNKKGCRKHATENEGHDTFTNAEGKKYIPRVEKVRTYLLKAYGIVQFGDNDARIEQNLLGEKGSDSLRVELALQELRESAQDVKISMELV